jgi:RNA polymerase sigma-70 factor, ECF subfamily
MINIGIALSVLIVLAAAIKELLSSPDRWVDQYGDYLFRYALSRLRDRALAEEAVQETFLAALKSKQSFEGQSSERTWLIGILKHKIIDHFRRSSRELPLFEDQAAAEPEGTFRNEGEWVGHWTATAAPAEWGSDPIRALQQKEFWEVLQRCLAMLPERLAQVFVLREMEEMSTADICKTLKITESNLWVMLHRARAQLRRTLESNYFNRQNPNVKI